MKRSSLVMVLCGLATLVTIILSDRFLYATNIENVLRRSALFGVLSLAAVFVLVVGGIDLSIGSVVCLCGVLFPYLLVQLGWSSGTAILSLLTLSLALGAIHGVLVAKLRVQPFIVTLCGLLVYRGAARGITGDQTQGFGPYYETLRGVVTTRIALPFGIHFAVPITLVIVVVIAAAVAVFLHKTVWGRYLKAIGSNEDASRYSGLPVSRMVILAYALCGLLSGIGGLLFVLDVNSAQPADFGNFFELYAIAGAVLGGCSLRGGEISVIGALFGAALMQILRNALTLLDIPTQLEYVMIGTVLLLGVTGGQIVARGFLSPYVKRFSMSSEKR